MVTPPAAEFYRSRFTINYFIQLLKTVKMGATKWMQHPHAVIHDDFLESPFKVEKFYLRQ